MPSAWKRTEPTTVIQANYRTLVDKTFIMPDGSKHVFTTVLAEDAVYAGVVALTPDKQVIVSRQFRPGPERIMDEIPGGGAEPGEAPETAARRELAEETGYQTGTIEFLGSSCRDAYMNATWNYYLALDCTPTNLGQHLDESEYVEVVLMSISEFLEAAKEDRVTDSVAVLMAYDKLKSYISV